MLEGMPEAITATRVLIIEDDPVFRRRFADFIATAPDMVLAGVAENCATGRVLLGGPSADVLLVDLGLPDGCGSALIREATQRWPTCNVMVVSLFGDQAHVMAAIEAGATGYLLKDEEGTDLLQQIRSLCAGGSPITPVIARQLLNRLAPPPLDAGCEQLSSPLSAQEKNILGLAAKGYSYEEVAALLGISRHTVMTHVNRSYRKLQVNSKSEAVYEARRLGIVKD